MKNILKLSEIYTKRENSSGTRGRKFVGSTMPDHLNKDHQVIEHENKCRWSYSFLAATVAAVAAEPCGGFVNFCAR